MDISIKHIDTTELDLFYDDISFSPGDVFHFDLNLHIGVTGETGADIYTVYVSNDESLVWPILIVDRFDPIDFRLFLEFVISYCCEKLEVTKPDYTYVDFANELKRYFSWEYDG